MNTKLKKSLRLKRDQKEAVSTPKAPQILTEFSQPHPWMTPDQDKAFSDLLAGRIDNLEFLARCKYRKCVVCRESTHPDDELCHKHLLPLMPCYCGKKVPVGRVFCEEHGFNRHLLRPLLEGRKKQDFNAKVLRHADRVREVKLWWKMAREQLRSIHKMITEQLKEVAEGVGMPTLADFAVVDAGKTLRDTLRTLRQHYYLASRYCKCGCNGTLPKGAPANQQYITGHAARARQAAFKKRHTPKSSSK